jgi:hypothetical protein
MKRLTYYGWFSINVPDDFVDLPITKIPSKVIDAHLDDARKNGYFGVTKTVVQDLDEDGNLV